MASVQCVFAQKSSVPCGPSFTGQRLQTLDELDAANDLKTPGRAVKVSWMILSRVGVNYLSAVGGFGHWTVCLNHRKEFLDAWQEGQTGCCHPGHEGYGEARHVVSLVMAVKVLQREKMIMPIGGKLCDQCKEGYEVIHSSKSGEKVVVVIPSAPMHAPATQQSLVVHSPFCAPPEGDLIRRPESPLPLHDASMPGMALTLKTEVLDEPDETERRTVTPTALGLAPAVLGLVPTEDCNHITIKTEDMEEEEDVEEDEQAEDEEEDIEGESESEMSSIFSEDSDDDRTWMPEDKKKKKKKEAKEKPPKRSPLPTPPPILKKKVEKKPKPVKSPTKSSKADHQLGNGNQHYFCKVCKITFFKQSSYKQHMRSNKQAHKDILDRESREIVLSCSDCLIAFPDRAAMSKHMADVHKRREFKCEKCDVYLKNESAFKSHNSKMHLERREKAYYCRECDQIFKCKVKHQAHIATHRTWTGDPGLQCETCGKIFLQTQNLTYQKHLDTHDSEPKEACSCETCSKGLVEAAKVSKRGRKRKLQPQETPPKPEKPLSLLDKMKNNFASLGGPDDEDVDNDLEEDVSMETPALDSPFQCGLCKLRFATPANLESHVANAHSAKQDESGKKAVKRFTSTSASTMDVAAERERLAAGQDGPDRNWAAEFGYGKASKGSTAGSDIFSKMKMKFLPKGKADDDDEDEDTENKDDFEVFRTRGFTGRIKASPMKAPRTLSDASLATRKRLEKLIKRARDFSEQANKKNNRGRKKKVQFSEVVEEKELVVEQEEVLEESDDEFFDDDDEALLIPLENGWVCEKKPKGKNKTEYNSSFWSPLGIHFESIAEIQAHCKDKKQKLDMRVFEKAIKKNPKK